MQLKMNAEINYNSRLVKVNISGSVAKIVINSPNTYNAFDLDMANALDDAIGASISNDEVQIVLLQGAGTLFSAGANIKQVHALSDRKAFFDELSQIMYGIFFQILSARQIFVAAAHKLIIGVALPLALCCDLFWVDDQTTIIPGYLDIGLFPNGGLTFLLPELIGAKKTMQLLLIDKKISALKAEEAGLVSAVFPRADFNMVVADQIDKIKDGSLKQYQKTKELIVKQKLQAFKNHLELEKAALLESCSEEEFNRRLNDKIKQINKTNKSRSV